MTRTLEPLERRQHLHADFSAAINFQPLSAPRAPGMLVDYGSPYAARRGGYTYGWDSDVSARAVDRNLAVSVTQRNDTFIAMQDFGTVGAQWELAVPEDGAFRVTIVAGDPAQPGERMAFTAEGSVVFSGATSKARRWLEGSALVNVTDGKLTISSANFSTTNKINYIVVQSVETEVPTIAISETAVFATEGGTRGRVRITRTGGDLTQAVTVPLTVGGTATNAIDYGRIGKAITFAAGVSTIDLNVAAADDRTLEGNETVIVDLVPVIGYQIGLNTVTVTILDAALLPVQKTLTWTNKRSAPNAKSELFGETVDGKLYVFGGYQTSGNTPTSGARVYDPATNAWSNIASLAYGYTNVAHTVAEGNIYFAGGYPGIGANQTEVLAIDRVFRYSPTTNTYTDLSSLPEARGGGSMARVGTILYFLGGNDVDGNSATDVYAYDLLDQAAGWSKVADLPAARTRGAAVSLNGFVYYIGGENQQNGSATYHSSVYRFNPANNTWKTVGALPSARSQIGSSAIVYDGRIVVLGGETTGGGVTAAISQYDPISNQWTSLQSLPAARSGGVAALIATDRFIYTSGFNAGYKANTYFGVLS